MSQIHSLIKNQVDLKIWTVRSWFLRQPILKVKTGIVFLTLSGAENTDRCFFNAESVRTDYTI